ncbi:hypothetical protein CJ030_MR1G019340 [Morella rubra]|uniref:Uncharacterized protein n=1 Tax=Morella rubra TaxID=262757 RepID=A0A6A1WNY5_9ROSI|nr:hypothetical protein CJ030_MR1G019340 [Morella rubra]
MKRPASYADSHVDPAYANSHANPYVASQMQHMPSQIVPNAGMNNFAGHPNSFPTEEMHPYKSSKGEGHWQWDGDVRNVSNQTSSLPFNKGKYIVKLVFSFMFFPGEGGNRARSYYQDQMPEHKRGSGNQANREPRSLPHEQDMKIGYDDCPSTLTFERLEQKFHDEIMNLAKEHSDAEDAENARHRENLMICELAFYCQSFKLWITTIYEICRFERMDRIDTPFEITHDKLQHKIIEINTRYQEEVTALRAKQVTQREELLRKESQTRFNQYLQAGRPHYRNTGVPNAHGYAEIPVAVPAEAHQDFATSQLESYRELPQVLGSGRTQGSEVRVPYPSGRVYDNAARYY